MKLFRRILIIVVVLAGFLIIISFFLPDKVRVERVVVINAEPGIIFPQLNDLHNYSMWEPWGKIDPSMKIEYFGPPSGVGSGYSWQSVNKEVGSGTLTITGSKPEKRLETSLDFGKRGKATGDFHLEKAEDGGTKVTWGFNTETGWNPFMKFSGLFMDQVIGEMFEEGLNNLKKISESHTLPEPLQINPMPDDSV